MFEQNKKFTISEKHIPNSFPQVGMIFSISLTLIGSIYLLFLIFLMSDSIFENWPWIVGIMIFITLLSISGVTWFNNPRLASKMALVGSILGWLYFIPSIHTGLIFFVVIMFGEGEKEEALVFLLILFAGYALPAICSVLITIFSWRTYLFYRSSKL